ncbi:DUF1493 family protein [Citrobacter farmeri]|nr:DUF1493 family protein [Citrobacter farmeri]MDB2169188.1 DUF1493 family protein [Citrobacter farmeri]MDZ7529986.1 DUF1493 family protein [Citrobacter farmeri]HAT3755007.1 DUF1493 family protein [Citrobacter amalonaticus]HAU5701967.1 DUF1493 family protein [Citrobacter freundii]
MDIFLMKIQDAVLELFRKEIPGEEDKNGKEILLELDTDLFDEPRDDLSDAIEAFQKAFDVDLSEVNWTRYFPWENTPLLTRWFKAKREEVEATRLPLTVRMFAESAEAGKWLFEVRNSHSKDDA